MTTPTLHRNGTGADELNRQIADAGQAVSAAIAALSDAAPNQRDYYLKPGAWQSVSQEHESRMERLRSVHKELLAMSESLWEQEMERSNVVSHSGKWRSDTGFSGPDSMSLQTFLEGAKP